LASVQHVATGGRQRSGDQAQELGLAGAVGADDGHRILAGNFQADAREGLELAVEATTSQTWSSGAY
jgi:hypothetical protein